MSQLTIAIPTFNRNEKLVENLSKLLPQISTQKIIIIDNHSDILVSISLEKLITAYNHIDVKVYRNKTNIGICANFLRCFEYCETEWMWLLSDDDSVCPDAIEILERDTSVYTDYHFFNYASSMVEKGVSYAEIFPENFPNSTPLQIKNTLSYREKSFTTEGLNDLIHKFDSFVNLLFVSSGVYNLSKVLPHLRIGYIYAYSLAPHLATVFASLGNSGKVLLSKDKLVFFHPPDYKDTWSRLTFSHGMPLLMEVPLDMDDESYHILFHKITYWFMNDKELFHEVNVTFNNSERKKRWMFIQLVSRTMFKKRNFKQWIKIMYFIFILFYPKFNSYYHKNNNFNSKDSLARL